jgi:hypothetical protein
MEGRKEERKEKEKSKNKEKRKKNQVGHLLAFRFWYRQK